LARPLKAPLLAEQTRQAIMDRQEFGLYFAIIVAECALLAFLEKSSKCVTNFQARKCCHAGTGLMLLQFDSRTAQSRALVYVIGLFSLGMTWEVIPGIPPFRFGKSRDIGMTVYLVVATVWFFLELPIVVLAPMFFADPAGAIVGKWLSGMKDKGVINPVWWRGGGTTKTIGGSTAVLVFTMLTFAAPATLSQRFIVGVLAVLAEALGGPYDNLLLVIVVVGSRLALNYLETGRLTLDVGMSHSTSPFQILLHQEQAFLAPRFL